MDARSRIESISRQLAQVDGTIAAVILVAPSHEEQLLVKPQLDLSA